jgi:hypothetical protein
MKKATDGEMTRREFNAGVAGIAAITGTTAMREN